MKKRVLLVDDEPRVRASLRTVLEPTYEILEAADAAEGLKSFKHDAPDLVLLDVILPGTDGLAALQTMRTENRAVPVIMLTGTKSVKTAVDAMKLGAADYLSKPFDVEELQIVIERTLGKQELEQEVRQLRAQVVQRYAFHNLIGKSPAMQEIYAKIEQVADSRTTVLVTGESGTGKELVAKAIHYNSDRRDAPFVPVNCAAIPEQLLESELFGHMRGSFTDAKMDKRGLFEEAQKGTLFLDEIADLDLALQVKLLRVLQEREVSRIGSNQVISFDVRIIVATHKNLNEEVVAGRFREDLFYRLLGLPVELPPLKERGNDILLLAKHFLDAFCSSNKLHKKNFNSAAREKLLNYRYPGNVRELKAVVELPAVMTDNDAIDAEDISFTAARTPSDLLDQDLTLDEFNQKIIRHYLGRFDNNVVDVARRLGIGKSTIYRMMKEGKL